MEREADVVSLVEKVAEAKPVDEAVGKNEQAA